MRQWFAAFKLIFALSVLFAAAGCGRTSQNIQTTTIDGMLTCVTKPSLKPLDYQYRFHIQMGPDVYLFQLFDLNSNLVQQSTSDGRDTGYWWRTEHKNPAQD